MQYMQSQASAPELQTPQDCLEVFEVALLFLSRQFGAFGCDPFYEIFGRGGLGEAGELFFVGVENDDHLLFGVVLFFQFRPVPVVRRKLGENRYSGIEQIDEPHASVIRRRAIAEVNGVHAPGRARRVNRLQRDNRLRHHGLQDLWHLHINGPLTNCPRSAIDSASPGCKRTPGQAAQAYRQPAEYFHAISLS